MSIKSCKLGHSYFPKGHFSSCPFCADLLRQFRGFASSKGGTLVSNVPGDVLVFRCHQKEHPEFPLQCSNIRANPDTWCPLCNPRSRQAMFKPANPREAQHINRIKERQRLNARIEEGKKDQAKLLSSAKLLYKLSHGGGSSSSSAIPLSMSTVRSRAAQDLSLHPDLSEAQCVVVRGLLASDARDDCWNILACALELPESTSREKLYRKAARLVHPDKCSHPQSGEAFKILSALLQKSSQFNSSST